VNSFNFEIFDDDFRYVTFYTVRKEGEEVSETEKFIERFRSDVVHKDDFQQIVTLIEIMGDERGATGDFFTRHEDEASALPPKKLWFLQVPLRNNKLRLYCCKISEHIVVLFNGGVKSAQTAQESEDLQSKFRDAKYFAQRIWKEIQDEMLIPVNDRHELQDFNGKTLDSIHIP